MKRTIIIVAAVVVVAVLAGCAPAPDGETGREIVSAEEALTLLADNDDIVLVDARPMPEYNEEHIDGAVNVSRADIVVMTPFPALLAPPEKIEENLGENGISNDTRILVYDDNNNMDAARFWWTLKIYGHDNVQVVSGGYAALQEAGASVGTEVPSVSSATFTAEPVDESMMVDAKTIREHLDEPDPNVVLVDTRSEDEFVEGSIPGAIHINYVGNNFSDGTFRPVRHIQIKYLGQDIDFDTEVWLYCLTSIRATQTYLALYNAGYRNLRVYDGAWEEWSANPMNPVFVPETNVPVSEPDQS
ncbi:MAG: sulfurtransferase [Alkalispirochaeta sp.]